MPIINIADEAALNAINSSIQTQLNEKASTETATQSKNGLLSANDKKKIDGIAEGANKTIIDSSLNDSSTNPVQNKVINSALSSKLDTSLKGAASGLAELDANGKVLTSQLPSYVDDVIEGTYVSATSFKDTGGVTITGETGKIYVDTTSGKTYRWSGSAFVVISETLALGETSSTAYRGDRGKTAYDHSQIKDGNPHGTSKEDLGLGNVDNTSDVNKPVSTAQATAIADAKKAGTDAQADIDSHVENDDIHFTATERTKLAGIATGANAYTLPTASSSTLGGVKIGSNISISSGKISVPTADGSTAGVTIVYPAASCTTFSSDSGSVTPLAVQKGAKMFSITRPTSSTINAITRYSNTTGDVKDSTILIEDVTNTRDTSQKAQVISVPAANGTKKMVYGYCTDQIDGTSFIGGLFEADAEEFPYNQGLAIGGSSGNLLWKGTKVATTADLPGNATTSAAGLMSAADKTKLNGLSAPTVTSDIPLKFSINANGGLTITYDDGK